MLFYSTIFIIIIIIYILYFIFPKNISINQTTIDKFNFDLLYEKQPLILSDHLVDIHSIISLWFKYNFIYHTHTNTSNWILNNFKYTIIYNSNSNINSEIHICNPYTNFDFNNSPYKNSNIVSITLSNNQFMILPYKWNYYIQDNFILTYNIHDFFTMCCF